MNRAVHDRPVPVRAGVTLLELLLVMMVLGIVLGAGVGMFATLDLSQRQARGLVKNVLRQAQNSAIARQAPARVRIDVENNTLTAEAMEVIGTWHFERRSLRGAFDLDGVLKGGAGFDADGFLGDALAFDGRMGSHAILPVQLDPAYDFRNGFSIECAIRRDGPSGGQVLVLSKVIAIDVTNTGGVRGWFIPRVDQGGRAVQGGRVLVESAPGRAALDTWVRIKLEYDRHTLALHVDGVPVASTAEDAPVWKIEEALYISGRQYAFHGSVDALVIGAIVASEVIDMPESVHFAPDTPTEISFAAGGGLDRNRHPEPLLLTLDYDDGSSKSLFVGTYGTVDG